ncbi:MAG TPA: hypothetical protein VIG80_14850 [Bacillaceae bacterium]
MKKLLVLLMGTLLLAACSANGGNTEKKEDDNKAAVESSKEDAKYPEVAVVEEEIGSGYEVSVENDSDEERVLLYKNDNGEEYKSTYIKTTELLKIFNLKEDRIIYNKIFRQE